MPQTGAGFQPRKGRLRLNNLPCGSHATTAPLFVPCPLFAACSLFRIFGNKIPDFPKIPRLNSLKTSFFHFSTPNFSF
jgi:hypothetical protein